MERKVEKRMFGSEGCQYVRRALTSRWPRKRRIGSPSRQEGVDNQADGP